MRRFDRHDLSNRTLERETGLEPATSSLEGLYSSHLAVWRAARRHGDLQGPAKRRGPPHLTPDPARKQIAKPAHALARATARAERVERAELIIDAPQKFSQLLGLTLPPRDEPTETRS
jgi:transposase